MEITKSWFEQNGCADPDRAMRRWTDRITETHTRSDDADRKQAVVLCTGYSLTTVNAVLERTRAFRAKTTERIESVAKTLGWTGESKRIKKTGETLRVAILADFAGAANPRFHLDVLESILAAFRAPKHDKYYAALQTIDSREPDNTGIILDSLLRIEPDAIVWFRITPHKTELDKIRSHNRPVIVVHGERFRYPEPVVAHIFPDQSRIAALVGKWAHEELSGGTGGKVIVAGVRRENVQDEFVPISGVQETNLRADRQYQVRTALLSLRLTPEPYWVTDFTGIHAFDLLEKHPDAVGFICLSDELAAGLRHLMNAKGKSHARPILGFDGSRVSRILGIPSLDQHLDHLGNKVAEAISQALRHKRTHDGESMPFREIRTPVDYLKNSINT